MSFISAGPLDPIGHRKYNIDRPELEEILHHIRERDHYLALRSPRQMGKTTLLLKVQDRLQGNNYGVANLDVSTLLDLTKKEFYQRISEIIKESF